MKVGRIRSACLGTLVAVSAVSTVAVSSAEAVPINTSLNYGYANIGASAPLQGVQLLDGTQGATLSGDLNTSTGTITNGHLNFPPRTFSGANLGLGPNSTVTIGLVETPANSLTGQYGPAQGQLQLSGMYALQLTLANNSVSPTINGECDYTLGTVTPLVMDTENTTPYHGRRFNNPNENGPGSFSGSGTLTSSGGPNVTTCAVWASGGISTGTTVALWMGHNSLPTESVPFSLSLDFSRLNVGAANDLSIIDQASPAVYTGTVQGDAPATANDPTPSTSVIVVPPGGLDFIPTTSAFAGHTLSFDLDLIAPGLHGTFDAANGAMTLGNPPNDQYTMTADLDSGAAVCTSTPDPFDLSTEKTTTTDPFGPKDGVRFAGLGGNGAMMDSWTSLPSFVVVTGSQATCDQLGGLTVGLPGGLWVSHGIAPVPPIPLPPLAAASASPSPVLTGQVVTFDASASTQAPGTSDTLDKYEWDLNGDESFELDTGTTPQATHAYQDAGDVTARVRVTTNLGVSDTATMPVSVRRTPPPGQLGITINNGAQFTNDPQVTVSAVWPPFAQTMLVSNDGGFLAPGSFLVSPTTSWTLDSAGSERLPKTLYVRFQGAGSDAQTFTDDIILDQTPPTVEAARLSGGPASTSVAASSAISSKAKRGRTLRVRADDNATGVIQLQIAGNLGHPGPWQPFRSKLRLGGKGKRVFVRVQDGAGNTSAWRRAK